MSLAQKLSQLRPLMTPADIEALLGVEHKKRALDQFSGFTRENGVEISFSHRDGVIDSIRYTSLHNFPEDVAVCGVRLGMTIEALRQTVADVRLADGETREPNKLGYVRYQARPASVEASLHIGTKDGIVIGFSLNRPNLNDVLASRKQQEAERRAEQDRKLEIAGRWKSIADPDAMLMCWAEHCVPWTNYDPQRFISFARWLTASRDPDVWHVVATRWNWDYGHAPLLWIVKQRACDIATALEIFYLAEPTFYFRWDDRKFVPKHNLEIFDFLTEIRERLSRGFYKKSEIAFDGEDRMPVFSGGSTSARDEALAAKFYPRDASRKIAGRDPTHSGTHGIIECLAILSTVN